MDRLKKGALEAVAKHQADKRAGKEQQLVDPLDYWAEMQSICATRLAYVAADLLTIPATSVPSERLFSVSGVMCAGEHIINCPQDTWIFSFVFITGKKHSISDENLQRRVLLKCNLDGLMED